MPGKCRSLGGVGCGADPRWTIAVITPAAAATAKPVAVRLAIV